MHRVGILIAGVTADALLVADTGVAECGVGGAEPEPELNFGLDLLADGSWRIFVAVAAGERVMSGIGRTFGMETPGLRYRDDRRDGCRDGNAAKQIGNDLGPALNRRAGSRL